MKKILLVDDSAAVRSILKAILAGQYEVIEASNGQEGLDLSSSHAIDLFLLDVNMPVMDGIALTKRLRESGSYDTTPIVMLTNESRDDLKQEGKAAGATGWIAKPCSPPQLLELIQKLI